MKNRVAITGMGVVSSLGNKLEEFWGNCLLGKSVVRKIPEFWKKHYIPKSEIYSPLENLHEISERFNVVEKNKLNITSIMALYATYEALEGAGIKYSVSNRNKNTLKINDIVNSGVMVSLGTGMGGLNTIISANTNHILNYHMKKEKKALELIQNCNTFDCTTAKSELARSLDDMRIPARFNPYFVSMAMPNTAAANIGIKFNLTGRNITSTAACASGTQAIGMAYKSICDGESKVAITGGVEHFHDECGMIFRTFDIANTLTRGNKEITDIDKMNRPFDEKRTGFLFSEGGCGILILEDYEHAQNRNAPIIAELIGFEDRCEGYNIMMMEPEGKISVEMYENLLKKASLSVKDIDYINTHGTGTELNDRTEAKIIGEVFGRKPLVNSTKSLLGHSIGASGAIEAIVTALTIRDGKTHICRNLDNPIASLNFVKDTDSYNIDYGLSESFAFGGHNAMLLFKKPNNN